MKDEYLYVLYIGMESATVLRKNIDGSKKWTERDLARAYRKGYVIGYDTAMPKPWPTIVSIKEVQLMYISDESISDDTDLPIPVGADDEEVMYG